MKRMTKGLLAGMVFCCMPMLAGCSFRETLGILWNGENQEESTEEETQTAQEETPVVDESVEVPSITAGPGDPVTYAMNAEAEPITVEASVSDGGTLSYQWYSNNVDSNGGGTALEGETGASFTPSTTEPGTIYYYVVITNTVDNAIQMTTSATKSVTVEETSQEDTAAATQESGDSAETQTQEASSAGGTWQQGDGGWWYEHADGSYTTNGWEEIDGQWYAFDENGYMRTGWFQDGDKWYYLNDDGTMARDTDVDGYHLGSDGVMQ